MSYDVFTIFLLPDFLSLFLWEYTCFRSLYLSLVIPSNCLLFSGRPILYSLVFRCIWLSSMGMWLKEMKGKHKEIRIRHFLWPIINSWWCWRVPSDYLVRMVMLLLLLLLFFEIECAPHSSRNTRDKLFCSRLHS